MVLQAGSASALHDRRTVGHDRFFSTHRQKPELGRAVHPYFQLRHSVIQRKVQPKLISLPSKMAIRFRLEHGIDGILLRPVEFTRHITLPSVLVNRVQIEPRHSRCRHMGHSPFIVMRHRITHTDRCGIAPKPNGQPGRMASQSPNHGSHFRAHVFLQPAVIPGHFPRPSLPLYHGEPGSLRINPSYRSRTDGEGLSRQHQKLQAANQTDTQSFHNHYFKLY